MVSTEQSDLDGGNEDVGGYGAEENARRLGNSNRDNDHRAGLH